MALAVRAKKSQTLGPSGLNFTVSVPTGAVAGDLLLLLVSVHAGNDGSDYTLPTPTGWTAEIDETANLSGQGRRRLYAWKRIMAAGDANWTLSGIGVACGRAWAVVAISGADATTPVPSSAKNKSDTNTTACVAPQVTTATDDAWLLCAWSSRLTGGGETPPGSMTSILSARKTGDGGNFGPCELGVMFELIPSAGATGTRTLTNDESQTFAALSLEIKDGISNQTATGAGDLEIPIRFGVPKAVTTTEQTAGEAAIVEERSTLIPICLFQPQNRSSVEVVKVAFASGRYITGADEEEPDTSFRARLKTAINVRRSVFQGRRIGGRGIPTSGSIEVLDPDGEFDFLYDLDWSDKPFEMRVAGYDRFNERIPYDEARRILKGRTAGIEGDDRKIDIRLSDLAKRFERKTQELTFAGTGGLEGGPELKGKRKPLVVGTPRPFKPIRVAQNAEQYVFHVDREGTNCQSVEWIAVGANLISTDDYDVVLTGGVNHFTINTAIQGEVTCKVVGPAESGTTHADLVRYVTCEIGPLTWPDDIDTTRLAIYAADYPGPAGIFLDDETTLATVLDQIAGPGGFWDINENEQLVFGLWKDPGLEDADHILRESQVKSIRRLLPEPVPWRIRLAYAKNFGRLNPDQVVEAARTTEYGRYAVEPFLVSEFSDSSILDRDANAPDDDPWETYLTEELDAEEETERIWEYQRKPWQVIEVEVGREALLWKLGEVVNLTHSRWSLSGGANFRIAELQLTERWNKALLWRPLEGAVLAMEDGALFALEDGSLLEIT